MLFRPICHATTVFHKVICSPSSILSLSWSLRLQFRHVASRSPSRSAGLVEDDKPYYVTTPIFYVNADPHVGHLYSMVLADIFKRWQQLCMMKRAILCTGTDEHGMKIQQAAAKAGIDPKPFCDRGAEIFKALAAKANVSYDHFVRTTDEDHIEAVHYAWHILQEKGYIYLSKHEGWYSVSDETFYPQSGVHLIVDPSTGRKHMASIETGKEVEWTSETNYRFRLSAFKDRLIEHYQRNPYFIIPAKRRDEIVQSVSAGLDDLSVSRPTSRLKWGIPVPTDDSQTIYVWLDALLNYLTKAGYPWVPERESLGGWPADCHVIGKDIIRFHCIYWPAFLMALDIPLPKQILTHGHWTLGREKMSKSTGNVVNPFFAIDRFGVDTMRYYLALVGRVLDDADYSNEHIINRYKKGLQYGLGNLTSRIIRGKNWNVSEAVVRGTAGELDAASLADEKQLNLLKVLAPRVMGLMDGLQVRGALKEVMIMIHTTNAYLQHAAPWDIAGSDREEYRTAVQRTVYLCAEALRIAAILLQPFMPGKMEILANMLGVREDRRTFDYAFLGRDNDYGRSSVNIGRGHMGVLFPPLTSDA